MYFISFILWTSNHSLFQLSLLCPLLVVLLKQHLPPVHCVTAEICTSSLVIISFALMRMAIMLTTLPSSTTVSVMNFPSSSGWLMVQSIMPKSSLKVVVLQWMHTRPRMALGASLTRAISSAFTENFRRLPAPFSLIVHILFHNYVFHCRSMQTLGS